MTGVWSILSLRVTALALVLLPVMLLSCSESTAAGQDGTGVETDSPEQHVCDYEFTEAVGQFVPVAELLAPHSLLAGSVQGFLDLCRPAASEPLIFSDSKLRTHHLILGLEHIYPLASVEWSGYSGTRAETVKAVSIDLSYNGISYQRFLSDYPLTEGLASIDLGGAPARYIRFVFAADGDTGKAVQDIRLKLAEGYIVKEDTAWSGTFFRSEGWTGADGIFSYNLASGDRSLGSSGFTGFVFSDTFVGDVFAHNKLRSHYTMVNNSLAYFDPEKPFDAAFEFVYRETEGKAASVFPAEAYTGLRARNLLDGDGLTKSRSASALLTNKADGTMWLSDQPKPVVTIDLMAEELIHELYIWNYNEEPSLGVKLFELQASVDGRSWKTLGSPTVPQASGTEGEPYTLRLPLAGTQARYLRLTVREGYDRNQAGLGKLILFGPGGRFLFGQVQASSELSRPSKLEESSRLWLQDGIVLDNQFYTFPLLVKDWSTIFKVHSVGMIKVPLVEKRFDYHNAGYFDTSLQIATEDGAKVYFGAGILDNRNRDGFLYVYGYKDLDGRQLVVARIVDRDIQNFNRWEFFDGQGWSPDVDKVAGLKPAVSPELSVTYIPEGRHAGSYMLVVMEGSLSGRIVYAIGESPHGPFGEYQTIYQTSEHTYLDGGFAYNAKMHAHLSAPGNYLVSYNVNTFNAGALRDTRIYYPRFIRMVEVGKSN
jgi:hypothetical protein